MRATYTLMMGLFVMLVSTGVMSVTDSLAAHPDRVDVISTLNDKVAQVDSHKKMSNQVMRVDVVTDIGPYGPAYPYSKPINR